MAGCSSFVLVLFVTVISVSSCIGSADNTFLEQREFDYFALALQWPPTYCRKTKNCCSSNACCRGSNAPPGFTIHGLWPDYNDGTWPACCTHSTFDEKEWGKHGTCSAPVVHDEYNYFLTALNVYFKYNVTEILNEAGYVPSNSEKYPAGGIISAIQNAFHATPELVCSNGALQELRLCFYKDFKPRDCAISAKDNSRSSCPKYISLPTYTTLGLKNMSDGGDLPWSAIEAV